MQDRQYDELEVRASLTAERDELKQMEAQSRVRKEIKKMLANGEAMTLTEEEEQMLRSFRAFKPTVRKDGQVFTWQTRRAETLQPVG